MASCNESSGDDYFSCIASAKGHYIQRNATNQLSLVTNQQSAVTGTLMMHNIYGQLIISKSVLIRNDMNTNFHITKIHL